ncbi:hypothetical protein SAMN06296036_110158 [Pseudobacteriovorax antillogorgiicola]|uniref:Uncharacterized protein n=1 Tax=Pseudobacteriovorax antillogorgiicola TaxID=1513793 RepID=A0A1Y6BXR3_9BACT|nr:hypothetical protein EDD56_113159 [Pseudobacteriovorax antillogorgiicola]SMF34754.1 hypothetical protein SAMN06296036_110158 [Pseudobacteriovorax antillogorgiicola]
MVENCQTILSQLFIRATKIDHLRNELFGFHISQHQYFGSESFFSLPSLQTENI